MNVVVIFEELKEFGKAIAVLESMREGYPNPQFLEQRIERLRERQYKPTGSAGAEAMKKKNNGIVFFGVAFELVAFALVAGS